jgi:nitrogen-specific signal transduction histidine kinase
MLVFARRGPLQVQATDVNQIVTAAVAMIRRSCPATIEVHTDLAPDLRWATADATQVQTAILNLAVNARDAMPAGGRLTLRTENAPLAAPAQLPLRSSRSSRPRRSAKGPAWDSAWCTAPCDRWRATSRSRAGRAKAPRSS